MRQTAAKDGGRVEQFVMVALFDGAKCRVGLAKDPADLLSTWRRRYGACILVVIDKTTDRLRPSYTLPLHEAADLFRQRRVTRSLLPLAARSIHQLGPLGGRLLSEWVGAASVAH